MDLTPEMMGFLKSFESYYSIEDLAKFLALVKSAGISAVGWDIQRRE